jgi:hypothetical protein
VCVSVYVYVCLRVYDVFVYEMCGYVSQRYSCTRLFALFSVSLTLIVSLPLFFFVFCLSLSLSLSLSLAFSLSPKLSNFLCAHVCPTHSHRTCLHPVFVCLPLPRPLAYAPTVIRMSCRSRHRHPAKTQICHNCQTENSPHGNQLPHLCRPLLHNLHLRSSFLPLRWQISRLHSRLSQQACTCLRYTYPHTHTHSYSYSHSHSQAFLFVLAGGGGGGVVVVDHTLHGQCA